MHCEDCALLFLNPQPSDEELAKTCATEGTVGFLSGEARRDAEKLRRATARHCLAEIARYNGPHSDRLLEISCGEGEFLSEAEAAGYEVLGVECSPAACAIAYDRLKRGRIEQGALADVKLPDSYFDVCVLNDVIGHARDPIAFLREIRRVLRPDGALFIAMPSLPPFSGQAAKVSGAPQKPGHLTHFNKDNIQLALLNAGFQNIIIQPDGSTKHNAASGMMVFSRKAAEIAPKLSVVVPAFNEASTIRSMMDALIAKEIAGMEIEIIVVESNSTDGTREIVQQYATHPRVKVILEEKPSGKGHAVRTGLAAATGTYVLIQDADLEYDMEDYESLVQPLVSGRHAFVLGSRHGGRNLWKMRQFSGQRSLSTFLNFGHWFFATLIHVLFWKKLRDPFTMFKVFRRDCLFGLRFECNRFDFDFELLIRLMQKGYTPAEIPVNYRSRSFKEGKKVSMWRDPLTWLAALVRLRFSKVDPMAEVERARNAQAATEAAPVPAQTALAPR